MFAVGFSHEDTQRETADVQQSRKVHGAQLYIVHVTGGGEGGRFDRDFIPSNWIELQNLDHSMWTIQNTLIKA